MHAAAADAIELHSQEAEAFDARYRTSRDFRERYELWAQLISRYSSPENRVVDIGCGSGVFSFEAARQNKTVLGIDGSGEMVALCRQKQSDRFKNLSFQQSRIEDLPRLGVQAADLVICSSVLEYVEDLNSSVTLLRNLLNLKGRLLVSLPNRSSYYRRLERASHRLTGKPNYLRFVKNVPTLLEFNQLAARHELELVEAHYYANWCPVLGRVPGLIPLKFTNNLFVGVYQIRGQNP